MKSSDVYDFNILPNRSPDLGVNRKRPLRRRCSLITCVYTKGGRRKIIFWGYCRPHLPRKQRFCKVYWLHYCPPKLAMLLQQSPPTISRRSERWSRWMMIMKGRVICEVLGFSPILDEYAILIPRVYRAYEQRKDSIEPLTDPKSLTLTARLVGQQERYFWAHFCAMKSYFS